MSMFHLLLRSKFRKLAAGMALAAFAGSAAVSMAVPAQAGDGIDTLRNCLATPHASLNVLVLMDKSRSMGASDKAAERATMVSTSLRLLANVASTDHPYRARLISWGGREDRTSPSIGWTAIDSEQDADIERIARAAKAHNADHTDWAFALEEAKTAFGNKGTDEAGPQCRLVLWMTDGALDVNNRNLKDGTVVVDDAERLALSTVCGTNERPGLIDWFRRHNILILGALLQNGMTQRNLDASNLFKAVVEGRVAAPASTATDYNISSNFTCGTTDGLLGQVQEGSNAASLAWKFIDLVAQARGLTSVTASGSRAYIDEGLGRVVVYSQSGADPTIQDATGRQICPGSACTSTRIGGGALTVTTVTGESRFGDWLVRVPGSGESAIYAQIAVPKEGNTSAYGLQTEVRGVSGRLFESERRTVTVDLKQASQGGPFPIEAYAFTEVCFASGGDTGFENERCQPLRRPSVQFSWSPQQSETAVRVNVRLKSRQGREYADHIVKSVTVMADAALPRLECKDIKGGVCYLNPIPNRNKQSLTTLNLVGGEGTASVSGWTCTGFTDGDLFRRTFACDVATGAESPARASTTIATGQSVPVAVEIGQSGGAAESEIACDDDAIRGLITYTVESDSGRIITRQQPVAFCTLAQKNFIAVVLTYLLLLLVGIGVPLLLLLVHARRAAILRAPDDSLRWVAVPVLITSQGLQISTPEGTKIFAVPRYDTMTAVEGLKPARNWSVGSVRFTATPPRWNPFDMAKFSATAVNPEADLWLSSALAPTDDPRASSVPVTERVTGAWLLRFSADSLEPDRVDQPLSVVTTPSFLTTTDTSGDAVIQVATGPVAAEVVLIAEFADWAADLKQFESEIPDQARWSHVWSWIEQERQKRAELSVPPQVVTPAPAVPGQTTPAPSVDWASTEWSATSEGSSGESPGGGSIKW